MVKQNLSHTMYFVLGVLAIATVLKYNLAETVWTKSHHEIARKQKNYKVEITEEEIKDFIRLWPDFNEVGIDENLSLSAQIEHSENEISWKERLWFVYHHVDAARFFYVQQRIDYLLRALEIKRSSGAIIKQLSTQQDFQQNPVAQEMVAFQQRRYDTEIISETEQNLLETYELKLRKLLKKYPVRQVETR